VVPGKKIAFLAKIALKSDTNSDNLDLGREKP